MRRLLDSEQFSPIAPVLNDAANSIRSFEGTVMLLAAPWRCWSLVILGVAVPWRCILGDPWILGSLVVHRHPGRGYQAAAHPAGVPPHPGRGAPSPRPGCPVTPAGAIKLQPVRPASRLGCTPEQPSKAMNEDHRRARVCS